MRLNDYQKEALTTAFFTGDGVTYCALGLCGEAGEFAEQVKKKWRDDDNELTPERKELMKKELGDVLWYLSAAANALDLTLEEVAQANIDKIQDRAKRNVQRGSGNNR